MKKINELQKRSSLSEGRNFGLGFAILNKINKNNYETYNAFTACRDYLNDFMYVESTGIEIGSVHGYNHKKLDCFKNKRRFHIGIKALHFNKSDKKWDKFDECQDLLLNNSLNLLQLLNTIEDKLNIPLSKIQEIDEDVLIINTPIYWTKNAPLISIYTLLIRCYFNITNEELDNDSILDILRKHKAFITGDEYMPAECVKFYEQLLDDKTAFNEIDYIKLHIGTMATNIHNGGIVAFLKNYKQYGKGNLQKAS